MPNRRKDKRIMLEETLEMLIIGPKQKNISIVIDEISYRGLRFKTSAVLPLFEQFMFKIPSLDENEIMKGKIVWQREMGNGFLYGFEIDRS